MCHKMFGGILLQFFSFIVFCCSVLWLREIKRRVFVVAHNLWVEMPELSTLKVLRTLIWEVCILINFTNEKGKNPLIELIEYIREYYESNKGFGFQFIQFSDKHYVEKFQMQGNCKKIIQGKEKKLSKS